MAGFDEQRTLASPTGAQLNLYIRRQNNPRGVIQISHGLAEHAARYARFADYLTERGYASYAHDHRGHGLTTAPDTQPRMFAFEDGASKAVDDIAAVHDQIAVDYPGLSVISFGHSMGGLSSMSFVQRHSGRLAGAAIWNANFSAGMLGRAAQAILAWERMRLGSDVPSRLLPKLTFQAWGNAVKGKRTDFDWLSHDRAEVDKYIADPLCGWDATVSMWADTFRFVFAGANDALVGDIRRDLPVNLVGGSEDPATDKGKAVEKLAARMRKLGFSNLVSKVYANTRHESLNELNRDLIMSEFADWADKVVAQA
ncbi:MAG: alpha/beta hydrolase [Mesorhizobium sp.]